MIYRSTSEFGKSIFALNLFSVCVITRFGFRSISDRLVLSFLIIICDSFEGLRAVIVIGAVGASNFNNSLFSGITKVHNVCTLVGLVEEL